MISFYSFTSNTTRKDNLVLKKIDIHIGMKWGGLRKKPNFEAELLHEDDLMSLPQFLIFKLGTIVISSDFLSVFKQ